MPKMTYNNNSIRFHKDIFIFTYMEFCFIYYKKYSIHI